MSRCLWRTFTVGILLAAVLCTTGCWNRREIDTLGFVLAAGIDTDKQGYLFSTQVVNTDNMGKSKSERFPPYFVFTSTGDTIFDAVRKTTHVSPNKLFWSHTKVLVISESMARKGIKPALEFFSRDGEERRNFMLTVTPGHAEEIIKAEVKIKKIPTNALLDLIGITKATSTSRQVTLNDFLREYTSSISILVPTVSLIKEQDGKERYYLAGSAAFTGDRLAAYFSPVQTRGALWVLGKVKSAILVAECPGTSGSKAKDRLAFEVFKAKSKMKVEKRQGRYVIKVNVKESGNLAEASCSKDEVSPYGVHVFEAIQKKKIEEEISEAIAKAKAEKTDVFGFGEAIHRAYPKEWMGISKEWNDIFASLAVDVTVDAKITANALLRRIEGGN